MELLRPLSESHATQWTGGFGILAFLDLRFFSGSGDLGAACFLLGAADTLLLETATVMKAVGCGACKEGYKGRVGIYEVVRVTSAIADLIMTNGNSLEISRAAREHGFADLRTSALRKCAAGLISLEEVNRVTVD